MLLEASVGSLQELVIDIPTDAYPLLPAFARLSTTLRRLDLTLTAVFSHLVTILQTLDPQCLIDMTQFTSLVSLSFYGATQSLCDLMQALPLLEEVGTTQRVGDNLPLLEEYFIKLEDGTCSLRKFHIRRSVSREGSAESLERVCRAKGLEWVLS